MCSTSVLAQVQPVRPNVARVMRGGVLSCKAVYMHYLLTLLSRGVGWYWLGCDDPFWGRRSGKMLGWALTRQAECEGVGSGDGR